MRTYSTLGWHMLEALGALELDRTEHPVMRAWALDAIEPLDSGRAGGMTDTCTIDHERGIMHVYSNPGRVSGKTAAMKRQREQKP